MTDPRTEYLEAQLAAAREQIATLTARAEKAERERDEARGHYIRARKADELEARAIAAERERDDLRRCQTANEAELRRADSEVGDLRARVRVLEEALRGVRHEIAFDAKRGGANGPKMRALYLAKIDAALASAPATPAPPPTSDDATWNAAIEAAAKVCDSGRLRANGEAHKETRKRDRNEWLTLGSACNDLTTSIRALARTTTPAPPTSDTCVGCGIAWLEFAANGFHHRDTCPRKGLPFAEKPPLGNPPTSAPEQGREVTIDYTNWRGERAVRRVVPSRLFFGATEHHPAEQWLLDATDVEKKQRRTFAVACIHAWAGVPLPSASAPEQASGVRCECGKPAKHHDVSKDGETRVPNCCGGSQLCCAAMLNPNAWRTEPLAKEDGR